MAIKFMLRQRLNNPRVNSKDAPNGPGGRASWPPGWANTSQVSDPQFDTADFAGFGATAPGNLRTDYVCQASSFRSRTLQSSGLSRTTPCSHLLAPSHFQVRTIAWSG